MSTKYASSNGLSRRHFMAATGALAGASVFGTASAAENATLVLTEDGSANAVDLANTGLDGFDIASIDLSFAENSDLTITEQDLLDLSQFSNTLVVHGDTNNEVTAIGAQNTNQTETIDGKAYEINSLGNDGTLIVDPDVNVNI